MSYTNHHVAVLQKEARKREQRLLDALANLLAYAEEGCPEGGYICVIEARAALKGFRVVNATIVGQLSGGATHG